MKMSIDEHIKILKSYHNGFTGQAGDFQDAVDVAIKTMEKYQKIERIIEIWHQDIYAKDFECIAEVAEVLEDGTNEETSN